MKYMDGRVVKSLHAKVIAVVMCVVLLTVSTDMTAFAYTGEEGTLSEYDATGNDLIENDIAENNIAGNAVTENDASEIALPSDEMADRDIETVSEEEWQSEESDFLEEGDEGENQDESVLLPFEQSVTVDDVVITVTADEGVFPEGAVISARNVTASEENEVTAAIDEVRDAQKNVAVSYTFDITVYDKDGNEIEPDTTRGSVEVAFKMAEIANTNLETDIYHVEETDGELSAESLDVDTENSGVNGSGDSAETNDIATIETDGFSYYTVEFTYGELRYVLEGDERVELSEILETVGIEENGETTEIVGSNDELFVPVFEGIWYIESLKAFSSEEWLKVTIDGVEYEIVVTDSNDSVTSWSELQSALNGIDSMITLGEDITAGSASTLTVSGNKTLDLNGHVISANGYNISVITVSSGASLTLCDSDADAEHYYRYNPAGPWVWDDSATSGAIAVDAITDSTAADTPIILKGGAITGASCNIAGVSYDGGGIYNSGNLTINGGNIVGNSVSFRGGGIYSTGSVEIETGNIVGNYSKVHGAGAFIAGAGSVLNMDGGRVFYNYSGEQAGGVYVSAGSFTLNDGIISHNRAMSFGGGVNCNGGTMEMYGGEISYNKTYATETYGYGGGVHNQGTMNMYGGCIKHNSSRYGGGIYNGYTDNGYDISGTLAMIGGSVTENNCSLDGGGICDKKGSITLGGTAQITDNTKNTENQNVYLPNGLTIAVASGDATPTTGMKIGVSMAANTGYFTTATATEECEKYFVADDSEKSVVFDSSKNQLQIVNGQTQKHDGITFLSWTSNNSLPSPSGNYYLTEDVTLSAPWTVPAGTTNLCLNGHVIKQGSSCRVIYVPSTAILNVYDCNSESHYFTRSNESEPWVLASDQTTPTELSVKGGVITGGVITGIDSGAGIFVEGKLSMYDGNVVGNKITNATADQVFGAGVFVRNSGVFDMHGGSIVGNACGANAGGVAVGANGNKTGAFNMYDGTISDNYAGLWGGGVNNWGTIVMKGGTIANNTAKTNGGGGVSNAATFTMTGGTIKNNNALTMGGGVVGDGTVTVGGTAEITDNHANSLTDNLSVSGNMNFASEGPTTGMNVGVTTRKTVFPASISAVSNTDYSQYFTSDKNDYIIYYGSDKMLYLATPSTVTIDLNGGSYPEGSATVTGWEYDPTNKTYSKKGNRVTLPDAPVAPAFMKFEGWKYNSNLYGAGEEVVFQNTETRTYTAEYVNMGSSTKTFATPGKLTDPDIFSLWKYASGTPKGIAQKVYFGGMPWYIVGKDDADGSLVLMSVQGNFDAGTFGSNSTYSTSTVRNYLNTTAIDKFTTAEQDMMQGLTSVEEDKLYLGTGQYMQQGVAVGSNNNIYVSMLSTYATPGSPYTSGGWFWLRTPYDATNVLIGYPGGNPEAGGGIHSWGVTNSLWILPAMNLNLSSVLFASAAPVASASTIFDDGMNFRIAAGDKIGSTAMFTDSKAIVTKGEDAGDLYLYVQGKDSSNDWVWSAKVTENSSVDVSDIHSGADLTECAIWLETLNENDRLAYAKEASATSPYTVTLNDNGGAGGGGSVEVTLYSDMPAVNVPTKDDVVFAGYYDAATGGTKYYNADGTSAKKWDKSSDATLYANWHAHSWTEFAGTGTDNHNILYAVCSEPGCEYYGTAEDVTNAVSVSVSVPSSRTLIYDGNDFEAEVTDAGDKWATIFGSVPSITYEYREHLEDEYKTASNKKDAGYYKACITADDETAYAEYRIAKLGITPSVSIADWTYGATPSTPSVTGNTGDGAVTYKYKKASEEDSAYSTTVPTACGEYNIKAEIAETKIYNAGSETASFEIGKAESTCTAPSAKQNLKYTGQNQELVTGGSTDDGTMKYSLTESGEYSTSIPVGKNAQEYTVYYKVAGDENHNDTTPASVTVTIGKGEWSVTSPVAKTGLVYTKGAQILITLGSAEGGTMKYRVGTEGSFDTSENYYSGTDAKTYDVYYKVEADTNHNEYVSATPVRVTISKANWTVTAPTATAPSFTGSAQAFINAGEVKDADGSVAANKMLYSLTGAADGYSASIPTATDVGSYTVYYKVAADDNHNEYIAKTIAATVEKSDRPAGDMPTVTMSGYTYGQTGSLPAPSLSKTPSENPTITYYYASENDFTKAAEWMSITATTLNVGTYYMFAELGETASYRKCHTAGAEFTIAKGTCTLTAPTGKTLKYNNQAQELINGGTVVGGSMKYSLTGAAAEYSASIPTGTNQGNYTVYYKVEGDANHEDVAAQTVTATIGKGEHVLTAPKALSPAYNGNEQVLISAGSCSSGTILYSLDGVTYTASISDIKGKEVASYTVYYKVEGNDNYDAYGPERITANLVNKPTPTPTPKPQSTSTHSESSSQSGSQPSVPVTSTVQYAATGKPAKNYVANNPTGSKMPLPYITTDGAKVGWPTIDAMLDAHKARYKGKIIGTLSITMNGNTAVDTKLIIDAYERRIPLSFVLDNGVAIEIPVVNSVLSNQAKEGKITYFGASSMTTAEAVSVKRAHAGLLPSDIVAIGGNANTPVVLVLCSNDKLSTRKSQLISVTFNAAQAGFKKGDKVYLYGGTSMTGISMYKTGKVDKNGLVTFSVPMVSNYWTIGSKNLKNTLFRGLTR